MSHIFVLLLLDNNYCQLFGMLASAAESGAVEVFTNPTGVKFLWVALLLAIAVIVGLATGCVLRLAHAPWKTALVTGGSAGAGTTAIGFWILGYLLV
ncbi:hypothetical protein [Amycolatopsis sp. NPDC059657]|uniref:hypothetical protein n=1 Tax=Amycolatopsis sp. NPDC059657 TaxID=3346899 RepID=UPI00366E531F